MDYRDVIFTEYTNTRTRDQLIDVLLDQGIGILVDVRLSTEYYPRDGRFYRKNLEKAAEENGIEYIYYKALGNKFKNVKDPDESKMLYQDNVKEKPELKYLVDLVKHSGKKIALLCYCQPPRPCHRFWLLELVMDALSKTAE